jgi:hypothetical protein
MKKILTCLVCLGVVPLEAISTEIRDGFSGEMVDGNGLRGLAAGDRAALASWKSIIEIMMKEDKTILNDWKILHRKQALVQLSVLKKALDDIATTPRGWTSLEKLMEIAIRWYETGCIQVSKEGFDNCVMSYRGFKGKWGGGILFRPSDKDKSKFFSTNEGLPMSPNDFIATILCETRGILGSRFLEDGWRDKCIICYMVPDDFLSEYERDCKQKGIIKYICNKDARQHYIIEQCNNERFPQGLNIPALKNLRKSLSLAPNGEPFDKIGDDLRESVSTIVDDMIEEKWSKILFSLYEYDQALINRIIEGQDTKIEKCAKIASWLIIIKVGEICEKRVASAFKDLCSFVNRYISNSLDRNDVRKINEVLLKKMEESRPDMVNDRVQYYAQYFPLIREKVESFLKIMPYEFTQEIKGEINKISMTSLPSILGIERHRADILPLLGYFRSKYGKCWIYRPELIFLARTEAGASKILLESTRSVMEKDVMWDESQLIDIFPCLNRKISKRCFANEADQLTKALKLLKMPGFLAYVGRKTYCMSSALKKILCIGSPSVFSDPGVSFLFEKISLMEWVCIFDEWTDGRFSRTFSDIKFRQNLQVPADRLEGFYLSVSRVSTIEEDRQFFKEANFELLIGKTSRERRYMFDFFKLRQEGKAVMGTSEVFFGIDQYRMPLLVWYFCEGTIEVLRQILGLPKIGE